jgi:hypothetical protein
MMQRGEIMPTNPPSAKTKFRYQRRSREAWRRAAGLPDGARLVDPRWLVRLLNAAAGSSRLTAFEAEFTSDLDTRFAQYGSRTWISEAQLRVLERLEAKLGLA